MNVIKISIIIKSNCNISAISSLLQQNNDLWECIIVNNTVKNIEQYIMDDKRFYLLKDCSLNDAINHCHGEYILFLDSDDILTTDAIDNILHIADFTNADIIKINSKQINAVDPQNTPTKCRFKYIFNHNSIMESVFNNLSEFCFKKDIVDDTHFCLIYTLNKAKDMAITNKTIVIKQQYSDISVDDIVDSYQYCHKKMPEKFWKNYFKTLAPKVIAKTLRENDKKTFLKFSRQIPLQLIPLRHRIMCYILEKTNK